MASLIDQGRCICKQEPREFLNLNKYETKKVYLYQEVFDDISTYYRVYQNNSSKLDIFSRENFRRYFARTHLRK